MAIHTLRGTTGYLAIYPEGAVYAESWPLANASDYTSLARISYPADFTSLAAISFPLGS